MPPDARRGALERGRELSGLRHVLAVAAERLHHLVVAREVGVLVDGHVGGIEVHEVARLGACEHRIFEPSPYAVIKGPVLKRSVCVMEGVIDRLQRNATPGWVKTTHKMASVEQISSRPTVLIELVVELVSVF